MLFRKHIVSTRTLFQLTAAVVFFLVGVEAAVAANSGIAPLLVPYTINTIAGTPQFAAGSTSVASGYFGEGVPATPYLNSSKVVVQGATLNGPFAMAVDSVGNVYIVDTNNFIIREVNAQTGLINTIAGVVPKGCSGVTCTLRVTGCADGVPASGAPIGSAHMEGIAIDAYGNVYFDDNTNQSVSVIYRGGTQVANFIKLVNPAGVATSGGNVLPGYVYHVAGSVNLTTCSGTSGTIDNAMAFQDNSNPPTGTGYPAAQFHGPALLTLDSAGNIYVADISNATVRVINTQATPQTFFQYTVQPGYMRSITNCNPTFTVACPTGTVTGQGASPQLNTGINGPVNAIVFNSLYKEAEVDAFGNIYQLNGTGTTGPPGIYAAAAYAGGAPLTNLLTAEAPSLAGFYGTATGNTPAELPLTYGNSYIAIGNPSLTSTLPGSYPDVMATQDEDFDIRPSSLLPDNFGSFWYMDNHYPELNRIDQYTSLATLFLRSSRATASVTGIYSSPATFTNPWYCVYGASGSSPLPWTSGPQTFDPQGDGCPAVVAAFSGGNFQTVSDGLGDIFVGDASEQLEREMTVNNAFPATPVLAATPVVQGIQVHFNSSNPPTLGPQIPDGPVTGVTSTSFTIAPGSIPDFTIDTTDPEFPFGSLVGGGAYGNNTKTSNFAMFAGLPTCTQLGVYPRATPVTDYDCLVYVSFNPTAPGIRQSQLRVTTANGSVYNFSLSGVGTGGQLAIDGGAATVVPATGLGPTAGIAVTQSGTLYIADPANNRIVVEPAGGGTQSNLTFTGVTPATLNGPMGVAVDSAANVYISDTLNNRVLKVNPLTGVATSIGNYVWIPGNAATAPPQYAFKTPQGLAVDASNNVYVADTGNSVVVEIPSNIALGGAVPLLKYSGAPKFVNPVAVAVDAQGNIYVADNKVAGAVIVELPPGGGDLVNVPGSQFSNTKAAGLSTPNGVAVDAAGNVYVSDSSKNVVVEIPSASGPGSAPFALNFPGLRVPAGLALDANGNLYVADSGNKQILLDYRQSPTVNFGNVPQSLAAPAQPVCANTVISDGFNIGTSGVGCVLTVTNIGSQPVTLTTPITTVVGAGNAAYTMTNSCTSPLPAGLTCTISPTFAPTADNGQSESVNVNGGPQSFSLTANGAQPLVNIVLSAAYTGGTSTTTPTTGATATITATLTQPHISGNTPSGSVVFSYTILGDGTTGSQTVALSGGKASFVLPTLLQGRKYTINANYTGDSLNSSTQAAALVLQVPGVAVTVTAASTSFTYGSTPPAIVGTVTGITDPAVTYKFTSAATATTPIGIYPVTVVFSGGSYLTYGFPPALTAGGAPATVTENAAPLTYTIPNFTSQYGAANISYGANAVVTGAVNGDSFSATFTPAQSSILNVGIYSVVPTVTGANAGNYTVTAPPSTLTITKAPVSISISGAQTSVLNTTAGVASATYQISVSSAVASGKGTPSGSVTITDNFTPITATGFGTPAAPVTLVVPLVAGFGTAVPFAPAVSTAFPNGTATAGIHQYSYSYSGDSNFQTAVVAPSPTAPACIPSAISANCLIVDNSDFTLTSPTGPIAINPGTPPSGNGLPAVPNQNTAFPESAVLFVNKINGFVGQVALFCSTQNPAYVSCFMTPQSVCFATTSTTACTNTGATAATVLAVQTPATLPLGFKFASNFRTSASRTVLAFLPLGFLAFCVRRRRRLSKALWMLIAVCAVSAGMSGCGGNQAAFYTPVPTGPQTVTVTACVGGSSLAACTAPGTTAVTRSFVVPINID